MRAIGVAMCVAVCTPASAVAQSPATASAPPSTEPTPERAPPPWSMPDLSATVGIGFDVELAVTTVETFRGNSYRARRTAFLASTLSAEARVSSGWILGGAAPYVTSGHPATVSGTGNISFWARWARTNRSDARAPSLGGGFALLLPTAKEHPDSLGTSDPGLASDLWISDFVRFRPGATSMRAHVDWRTGTRTFLQVQLGVDLGLVREYSSFSPFVLPRVSVGAGSFVWRRLALVAEAVGVSLPGSGHDLGDGARIRGNGEAGLRYMGRRFYTGLRFGLFAGNDAQTGYGGGTDFTYLF
jgi:hypothetical protein